MCIRDSTIDWSKLGSGGWAIPSNTENIQFKKVNAKFVLYMEKAAIWERLHEDKFWKKYNCILMGTGGQAARGTRRLIRRLKDGFIASERKFTPVEFMPITDIMFIVKKWGLVHPAYKDGLPRVSCTLCPYRTLYEFNVVETLEDPGLIDEVLLKEHRKSYVYSKIPFEDFVSDGLWRFKPNTALRLYKLKNELRNYLGEERILNYRQVKDLHVMSWGQCERIRVIAEFVRVSDLVNRVERALNILGISSGS